MKINSRIARIHAHICADGCAYITKVKRSPGDLKSHKRRKIVRKEYIFEYWNNCELLLEEFKKDFKLEFNRNISTNKRMYVRIKGIKYIMEKLELMNKNSKNWFIPSYILKSSNKAISNWIRAFFDDEATVESSRFRIRAKSVNLKGLKQISLLLNKLGIMNRVTGPNCDNSWYLSINGSDIQEYSKKIGFLHPEKQDKLKSMIKKKNGASGTFTPSAKLKEI